VSNGAIGTLLGKTILVVEDDYMVATDISAFLAREGATIIGPAGTVRAAGALLEKASVIDAAVLDVNLRNERVYPVADELLERGVPFVFATGYEELLLDRKYVGLPRSPKPIDKQSLLSVLLTLVA